MDGEPSPSCRLEVSSSSTSSYPEIEPVGVPPKSSCFLTRLFASRSNSSRRCSLPLCNIGVKNHGKVRSIETCLALEGGV